ncbi:MAG: UDP-N-acetylmuramoyl-L-alanyl-D-glutamate--2,6-diaminopimelate ligase [bacterium]|nr:UDP-N-acetylmuramoyl-L-alanyl-D-glutamate--2,6-diaminopimelate ligase [bacterium]MCP4800548.1 UDP-N-acetylmuramoyl-L-alanyl-D-glutamate--2,6-diaminopimelate ligase [bacterium]
MAITTSEIAEYLGCSLIGENNVQISDVTLDSRVASSGSLFAAVIGTDMDGHQYVQNAIDAGCSAVMIDSERLADFNECSIPVIVTTDTRLKAVMVSRYLNGNPDEKLFITGVTGTNGKTTSSYLIHDMLTAIYGKCGLIGTIQYHNGVESIPAPLTTPDGTVLYPLLREMLDNECTALSMEISSHALDQQRVAGLNLDIALFTNLSRDHLDYHQDIDSYLAAKMRILDLLSDDGVAVVNIDDSAFKNQDYGNHQVFTWSSGWRKEVDKSADLFVSKVDLHRDSTTLVFCYNGSECTLKSKLTGWFNVENLTAAIAVALASGFSPKQSLEALAEASQVPGRMESILLPNGAVAIIDYAHTPDALEAVLLSCRDLLQSGKLVAVFGCGGDRDKGKRPLMGAAVAQNADILIVTSDNPRSEDPETICAEIVEGCINAEKKMYISCEQIVDRKSAIEKAITEAGPEDIIVIAGKGHETYQILADKTIDFDDREIVRNWIRSSS